MVQERARHGRSRDFNPYSRPNDSRRNERKVEGIERETKCMSIAEFAEIQSDKDNITEKYREYYANFAKRQLETYFNANSQENWFKTLFHPAYPALSEASKRLFDERHELFSRISGQLDGICYNEGVTEQVATVSNDAVEKDVTMEESDLIPDSLKSFAVYPSSKIVTIKDIPFTISDDEIHSLMSVRTGFRYIYSDLRFPREAASRSLFAVFEEETDIANLLSILENIQVNGQPLQVIEATSITSKVSSAPSLFSSEERVKIDLANCVQLVELFDKRQGIESSPIVNVSHEPLTHLDILLTYLRKVHLFCYYCAVSFETPEQLVQGCGNLHLRKSDSLSNPLKDGIDVQSFEPKLTPYFALLDYNLELEDEITKKVVKVEDDKYRCDKCSKLFRGPEFVNKHINLKHEDLVSELNVETHFYNSFLKCATTIPLAAMLVRSPIVQRRQIREPREPYRQQNRPNRPSRPNRQFEPRPIRPYVDLDAPPVGDFTISYE